MCKLGDIIVVDEFKNEIGEKVNKHSFVVINDEPNSIEGFNYDFVSNMLCSFHGNNHKKKKLRYKENIEVNQLIDNSKRANNKSGFIKADQLYYFDKSTINYYVLGRLNEDLLDELLKLILVLNEEGKIKLVTTNIEKKLTTVWFL